MNITHYVKIALFFIVVGSAGVAYIILSADGLSDFNTRQYEVVIPDASGLSTRSKVYLAGVAVGTIKSITLVGNEARLKVALLKDVAIREDAHIARKASSILGTSVLTLNPGTALSPVMPPGGHIATQRNTQDLNAIMGMVQELGSQVTDILREFQTNQMALLSVSLETFNSIARKLDAQSDAELDRVSRILESTALITERAEGLLREGDISSSVADIHGALSNIRMITDEIRRGQGNIGQAIYDDRLYDKVLAAVEQTEEAAIKLQTTLDNFSTLTVNVNGVVTNAGEIVERAVGLGIQVDTKARYEVLTGQVRAGASLRLTPRSNDRWYRIGVSSVPNGVGSRIINETFDENGTQTVTRFSFAIDAELARCFGPLTIRGGLLENTAGIGIDIQPLRWVSLSGEVFNFKTGAAPNLRGTLTIYPFFDPNSDKPWNWIYLQGGITNALNADRDFFISGGLRFADREVKGLVGLVPLFQ
ncbi:MAG: MlaD family protein [Treponema sp.]|jgi:phospholipid/cholesterol/gamma-HCH transport system substrate-binding protein|nr:MlaD family protein [Treponema sp.]